MTIETRSFPLGDDSFDAMMPDTNLKVRVIGVDDRDELKWIVEYLDRQGKKRLASLADVSAPIDVFTKKPKWPL